MFSRWSLSNSTTQSSCSNLSCDDIMDNAAPYDVVGEPRSAVMTAVITCKQCINLVLLLPLPSLHLNLRNRKPTAYMPLVFAYGWNRDTNSYTYMVGKPFFSTSILLPYPRFILADNSDHYHSAYHQDQLIILLSTRTFSIHHSINRWWRSKHIILKQIIDFITSRKVHKGLH
jgi:hypothetical protein